MWLFYISVIAIFDVTLAADFYTRMSLFFSTVTKLGHRVTHRNCETGNTTKQSFQTTRPYYNFVTTAY